MAELGGKLGVFGSWQGDYMTRTYEAIAQELKNSDVQHVFGVLGIETAKLGAEFHRLGGAFLAARHENQSVAMAAGYARVSGKVGVAINSRGPGLTNSLTAMAAAAKARYHVLIITGAPPLGIDASIRKRRADWKHLDQEILAALVDTHYVRPESPTTVLGATRSALEYARTQGTVCLGIPDDWMEEEASVALATTSSISEPKKGEAGAETISLIADFLETGWAVSRPVILAGRGAVDADAGKALRRLGELIGSLMATTIQARSFFEDDPYCIGVCGESSTPLASELIMDSNALFVFGAALNEYTTSKRTLLRDARIIQVDEDADAMGVFVQPDLAVVGDACTTALALVAELERRGHSATGYRTSEVRQRIRSNGKQPTIRDESRPPGIIDPQMLMMELNQLLARERIVVLDGGDFMGSTLALLDVEEPNDYVQVNSNWPTIGLGMGTAIGAATACPSRTTVLSTGDAGLMMALGDLETAIRHRLPILTVVSNDQAWGSEAVFLQSQGLPADVTQIPTPSFAAVARSMGGAAHTVQNIDDLRALEDELDRVGRGPLVLDCRINAAWMK